MYAPLYIKQISMQHVFNRLFWKINVWKNTLCCFFPLKDLKALGLLDSMLLISCLKNVKKSEVYVFDMHF